MGIQGTNLAHLARQPHLRNTLQQLVDRGDAALNIFWGIFFELEPSRGPPSVSRLGRRSNFVDSPLLLK
jgi:hypothetical protein